MKLNQVDDVLFLDAIKNSKSFKEVGIKLNIKLGHYNNVKKRCERLHIAYSHLTVYGPVRKWTDEQLIDAVKTCKNYTEVHKILFADRDYKSRSFASIKRIISKLKLDTSHFIGQGWRKGTTVPPKMPIEDYLTNKRTMSSSDLKKRLIREGLLLPRCDKCKRKNWNKKPIPIELHHIDGNNQNNQLSNLQILCPNCHAQTSNYKGKNVKKSYK